MSKARNLSDFISDPTISSTEIADQAVTHPKLHGTMDLSSKTVTLPTLSTLNTTGNVGIGTSSPSAKLHVSDGGGAGLEVIPQTTNDRTTLLSYDRSANTYQTLDTDSLDVHFNTSGTERMRIDSSGNLLVGTTDADPNNNSANTSADNGFAVTNNVLRVAKYNDNAAVFNRTGSDGGILQFRKSGSTVGNIGTTNSGLLVGSTDSALYFHTDNNIYPYNPSSNSYRNGDVDLGWSGARFKDLHLSGAAYTGTLLVGKTSTSITASGLFVDSNGTLKPTSDGAVGMLMNRKTSDGDLIEFRKDNTTVGSIATYGGDLIVGTGDTRLRFVDSLDSVLPVSNSTGTSRDAGIDLGHSETRFKDIYISGGIYLGAASSSTPVAANKLDDYEEGTWTPVLGGSAGTSGQSYATQAGTYTKIGNVVHLVAYVVVSSIGSVSGTYGRMYGLPFTVAGGNGNYAGGFFQYFNQLGQNVNNLTSYAETGQNFAYVTFRNGPGTAVSYLSPAGWGSAPQIMFSMTYRTNA